jgi:LPXTG-site transpeptidase (sortase) family protein
MEKQLTRMDFAFGIIRSTISTALLIGMVFGVWPNLFNQPQEVQARIEGLSLKNEGADPAFNVTAPTEGIELGTVLTSRLIASDTGVADAFGWSLALSGDTAVIGAPRVDLRAGSTLLKNAGAAYIFQHNESGWIQQAKLVAKDADEQDAFGTSVAISGNTVVVGAVGKDLDDLTDVGAAYVFIRNGLTWSQQARLVGSDFGEDDYFGVSVGIDGNSIVVGADGYDLGGVPDTGAAYAFIRRGGSWYPRGKLLPADPSIGAAFGTSLSVSGYRVAIGATEGSSLLTSGKGSVYLFSRNGSNWVQDEKLEANDGRSGDFFGSAVAISGDKVAVGAAYHDPDLGNGRILNAGSVYVFALENTGWKQQSTLVLSDAMPFDYFGKSVAIDGDLLVASATGKQWAGYQRAGAAYLFKRQGREWEQANRIYPDSASTDDNFGQAVAIDRKTILIGANGRDTRLLNESGEAFVFNLIPMQLPETGYAPGKELVLRPPFPGSIYSSLGDLWLEIPLLHTQTPIVLVPKSGNSWNVDWLGDQAGYLEGTAFPTWQGNTAIAAHVSLPSDRPGPFSQLPSLKWGDKVIIHAWGQSYIYLVKENRRVSPEDMSILGHESLDWLTLITCHMYDQDSGMFRWRTVVRAVLVNIQEQ